MLTELTRIESQYGEDRVQDVIRTIHHLMNRQFIYSGDRGSAVTYNIATDARFDGFIRSYFDAAGYDLIASESEKWVGILPRVDEVSAPRMRVDETIALLNLALIWQESVNAGDVQDRASVLSTVNTLFNRYEDAVAKTRKTAISIARFVEILKDFERRAIIDLGLYDPEEQDQEITIRPIINRLVGAGVLEQIERFVRDKELSASALARARTTDENDSDGDDPAAGSDDEAPISAGDAREEEN